MNEDGRIIHHTGYINNNPIKVEGGYKVVLFSYKTFILKREVLEEWVANNKVIPLELYRSLDDAPGTLRVCGELSQIKIDHLNEIVYGILTPTGRSQFKRNLIETLESDDPLCLKMYGIFDSRRNRYECKEIKGMIFASDYRAYRGR